MSIPLLMDPSLVDRLQQGDERAFRVVFDRLHRKVYQFAFQFLKDAVQSEEVVQDTFLNFWLHRDKLDGNKPIDPYLYVIARRTVIDHWRKAMKARSFKERYFLTIEHSRNTTEEEILFRDLERITEKGMNRLSEQQKMIVIFSRFEGLSYEEIAVKMQISKDTVKYHLVNAMKILRKYINNQHVTYLLLLLTILSSR